jgi:hypothetical protein
MLQRIFAVIVLFLQLTDISIASQKTCFCNVLQGPQGGPFPQFTSIATNYTINTVVVLPVDTGNCKNKCNWTFIANESAIAQQACAQNVQNGNWIIAMSQLSTASPIQAISKHLVNIPSQPHVDIVCPAGWLSNTSNIPGGITLDGRCKKEFVVQGLNISPPPNGTPIGTWGFYWGNSIVAYGSATNGGAAYPHQTLQMDPAVCKLQ